MSTRIAVLGDGAMGTVCAILLSRRSDVRVCLWSARAENARLLREKRENVRYLPGVPIPPSVSLTTSIHEATAGADLWVLAVPTVYLRKTLEPLAELLRAMPTPFVSVAKGLEMETFLRPTEIVCQVLGDRPAAVLSGPSHAEEVGRGLPASVVVASDDQDLARRAQTLFTTDRFRVYTNADMLGVELAGALKNIVGIAAGISDGLGFGDNTKSALLTRALVEMIRFGTACGAVRETFFGLAGIGDMITTCISPHGRNLRVGWLIGQGKKLSDVLAGMDQVAEGVFTARSVHDRARQLGLDMPITNEVYKVLYEDKDPAAAVQDLMTREPKSEKA